MLLAFIASTIHWYLHDLCFSFEVFFTIQKMNTTAHTLTRAHTHARTRTGRGTHSDTPCSTCSYRSRYGAIHFGNIHTSFHFSGKLIPRRHQPLAVATPWCIELDEPVASCGASCSLSQVFEITVVQHNHLYNFYKKKRTGKKWR